MGFRKRRTNDRKECEQYMTKVAMEIYERRNYRGYRYRTTRRVFKRHG